MFSFLKPKLSRKDAKEMRDTASRLDERINRGDPTPDDFQEAAKLLIKLIFKLINIFE